MRNFEPPPWVTCEGEIAHGHLCDYFGPPTNLVTVEWMPEHLRESHEAARNSGQYPLNGAIRLDCCPECAEVLSAYHGKWATVIPKGD